MSNPLPELRNFVGGDHTGATRAGREVAAAAADLKRAHLELGGKAPVIVFDDGVEEHNRIKHVPTYLG